MVFKVEPNPITAGESTTLYWQVLAADGVLLRGPEGEMPIGFVGNLLVQPRQNANYTLVARNGSGEVTGSVDLVVNPALPTTAPLTATIVSPIATPVTVISPTITTTTLLTPRTGLEATPLYTTTSPLPTAPSTVSTSTMLLRSPLATQTTAHAPSDLAPIALATVPPVTLTPVADPVLAQNRLLAFFGGVAVAVVTPLVLLLLVGIFWLLRGSK